MCVAGTVFTVPAIFIPLVILILAKSAILGQLRDVFVY